MKSREELRAWMQAGCQVPDEPEILDPCWSFTFDLWPERGIVRVTCGECGAEWQSDGLQLGELVDAEGSGLRRREVLGKRRVLEHLCAWADSHTKVAWEEPTFDALKGDRRWKEAARWIDRLMNGEEATMCLGGVKKGGKYRVVLATEPIKELVE